MYKAEDGNLESICLFWYVFGTYIVCIYMTAFLGTILYITSFYTILKSLL